MPDLEEKGQNEAQESADEKSGGFKPPLKLILIGAGIFAVAIAAFSFSLGVFSSGPAETDKEKPEQAVADTTGHEEAEVDELSEIEALEKQIFGSTKITPQDISSDNSDTNADDEKESKNDSIQSANWLETEKKKLAAERAELEALKKSLDAQEKRVNKFLARIEKMEESRIGALAKLYEGMKETQVAPLLNQLTDEQAVQILMSMKPANAAKVLGVLSPQRAARISTKMITLTEE